MTLQQKNSLGIVEYERLNMYKIDKQKLFSFQKANNFVMTHDKNNKMIMYGEYSDAGIVCEIQEFGNEDFVGVFLRYCSDHAKFYTIIRKLNELSPIFETSDFAIDLKGLDNGWKNCMSMFQSEFYDVSQEGARALLGLVEYRENPIEDLEFMFQKYKEDPELEMCMLITSRIIKLGLQKSLSDQTRGDMKILYNRLQNIKTMEYFKEIVIQNLEQMI
jgi:hypothetical protein